MLMQMFAVVFVVTELIPLSCTKCCTVQLMMKTSALQFTVREISVLHVKKNDYKREF